MRHLNHLQDLDTSVVVEVYQETFTAEALTVFKVVADIYPQHAFVIIYPADVGLPFAEVPNIFAGCQEADRGRLRLAARTQVDLNKAPE